jgi:hypothetical protein
LRERRVSESESPRELSGEDGATRLYTIVSSGLCHEPRLVSFLLCFLMLIAFPPRSPFHWILVRVNLRVSVRCAARRGRHCVSRCVGVAFNRSHLAETTHNVVVKSSAMSPTRGETASMRPAKSVGKTSGALQIWCACTCVCTFTCARAYGVLRMKRSTGRQSAARTHRDRGPSRFRVLVLALHFQEPRLPTKSTAYAPCSSSCAFLKHASAVTT